MIKFKTVPYQQKNGKIINRCMWTDDDLSWYWIGARIPINSIIWG